MARSLNDPRYREMIERLVALRREAELTQRSLAERLGEFPNYVWKIERCQQRLDPLQLMEWLRAIGADERKFLLDVVLAMPPAKKKRRTE